MLCRKYVSYFHSRGKNYSFWQKNQKNAKNHIYRTIYMQWRACPQEVLYFLSSNSTKRYIQCVKWQLEVRIAYLLIALIQFKTRTEESFPRYRRQDLKTQPLNMSRFQSLCRCKNDYLISLDFVLHFFLLLSIAFDSFTAYWSLSETNDFRCHYGIDIWLPVV